MNLLTLINDTVASAMDWILGWMLWLPRDLHLLVLAVMTSVTLALARKWCADQGWLKRSTEDQDVLKKLMQEAKKVKDREAVARYTATRNRIQMLSLRQEWKAVLGALLPVALVATWAFSRSAFVPPRVGDTVEIRMFLPNSAIGQWAHLAPMAGLEAAEGWVQPVVQDTQATPAGLWDRGNAWIMSKLGMVPPLEGVARWHVKVAAPQDGKLRLRFAGRTYELGFLAGSRKYAAPIVFYPDSPVQAVEAVLKPVKLFGLIGGLDLLFVQPWLLGYLVLAIALMNVTKRVLHTH